MSAFKNVARKGAFKSLIKLMTARRKRPKKRSLHAVNEHFEAFSNAAGAASAGF
ncbi:MAG: hypothetical protein PSX71_08545 [bacterium]|nr:hypothetical protein [bacterium]